MSKSSLTRREFVMKVGQFGGCAFTALHALGFVSKASGAGPDLAKLDALPRSGRKVIILGGGIAGLTAAYELGKVGIDSLVLEPRAKAGGRCLTFRKGDVLEETNGFKQTCDFEDGLYFNPGPSRFPHWHITMDYCRELGVEIEPFINLNENAYYYSTKAGALANQRIRIREAKTDLRGYAAELLAKVADQGGLDERLAPTDVERMVEFLRLEGGLQSDFVYRGHNRRGYAKNPGAGLDEGELGTPYSLDALLAGGFGAWFHRANDYLYQSQMFTPKGGMDQIATALHEAVKDKVLLGAQVKEIRRTNPGVRIVYEQDGETHEVTGDYSICTIPPTIMRRLPNDFSMMVKNTLNIVPFQNSGKIALQFKRRFWEEDDRIFGGLSWTDLPIGEVWYQNNQFFRQKGLMNGYYLFGPVSDQVGAMTPEKRTAFALEHGSKIHPQYHEEFESAFSCNWATIPHIEGCLAHFPQAMLKTFYPFLIKPEGELYLAASWASHLGGWQAGAFESARNAVHDIYQRIRAA